MKEEARPSAARRKALAATISLPSVSNFFPLTGYYEAADKLYESVLITSKNPSALDLCYVYGKRYCIFFLESIPKHNYYGTAKFAEHQLRHTNQVQIVLDILDDVANRMDQEELALQQQRERENQARLDAWRKQQMQQQQTSDSQRSKQQVAQSALDKLNAMNGIATKPTSTVVTPGTTTTTPGRTRYRFESDDEDDGKDSSDLTSTPLKLSTPMLPPVPPPSSITSSGVGLPDAAPPSYHDVVPPPTYESAIKKYHPFSYEEQPQVPATRPTPPPEQAPAKSVPELQTYYKQSHHQLQTRGRIRVQPLNTFQGRITASTNGCTVISALVAATHLNNSSNISNDRIGSIIDRECCPVLKDIRKKLGLGGHALIIPSDVHDHLVDAKVLSQEKFTGAAGGNILDPEHYGEFLKLLTDAPSKASATFFYREHVISIVKCRGENNAFCYDWVDSLPGTSGRGTRTRCADAEALRVQLQWYAVSKLRPGDAAPWDDSMADLDPRVFQGFVWSDAAAASG